MPGMVHFAQHVSPSFQLTDVGDGVGKARERQETPAISVLIRGWTFRWPTFNSHHQNQNLRGSRRDEVRLVKVSGE
jgi:hypothetical protein